jgi:hypothetical protein
MVVVVVVVVADVLEANVGDGGTKPCEGAVLDGEAGVVAGADGAASVGLAATLTLGTLAGGSSPGGKSPMGRLLKSELNQFAVCVTTATGKA